MSKTIVIFSDGTGNSSAKLFKTNVWRLYQALDLKQHQAGNPEAGDRRQIAYYDNGVGTSSFKPFALLGGAFGFGLKRNVLDLYTFLCRNYEPGDHIYAFGFSRGAFTIRILIGLVTEQGLLTCADARALSRYAPDAYRACRRSFGHKRLFANWLRNLRDGIINVTRRWRGIEAYGKVTKVEIDTIQFAGVWDTVAAYGMPIAELTRGVDRWIWPLSMPNYRLSDKVSKACHAFALDDERDTFHPLVWDEVAEQDLVKANKVTHDRLEQVWFSGMHSDVGGGYPDDSLAYVSLDWMMAKASAAGLRFKADAVRTVKQSLSVFGPMHDSRRGIGAYYRYQPRRIDARMDQSDGEPVLPDRRTLAMQDPLMKGRGLLRSVTIHESVFDRIGLGSDHYAPVVIPRDYRIACADGSVIDRRETEVVAQARVDGQEWVWNDIWKRRATYFATVGVSLLLVLFPWIEPIWEPAACQGPQCLLSPLVSSLGLMLPGFMGPWIDAFARSPGVFIVIVAVISVLLMISSSLQRRIHDGMRRIWTAPPSGLSVPDNGLYRLRSHFWYQKGFQFLKWRLAPNLFGAALFIVAFATAVFLPLLSGYRVQLALAERSGAICDHQTPPSEESKDWHISQLCWSTGVQVKKDEYYRVTLTVTEPWLDPPVEAGPMGFGSDMFKVPVRYIALALRRSLGDSWLQPIIRIVPSGSGGPNHVAALDMQPVNGVDGGYSARFTAASSGKLQLSVNDALFPWKGRESELYGNNRGAAIVQIEQRDPVGLRWVELLPQAAVATHSEVRSDAR